MKDSRFMDVADKARALKQWETFLKRGLRRQNFTKPLYHHLTQHCSFIAHYDLDGFYETYFHEGEDTVRFLSQFDNRNGIPASVEYGMTYWYTDTDYNDINSEMCKIASKYIPSLLKAAQQSQKNNDILQAKALLAPYGLKVAIRG